MAGRSESRGGGVIVAGAVLGGTIIGLIAGQPSIGVIGGTAIGVVAAMVFWLRDRARR